MKLRQFAFLAVLLTAASVAGSGVHPDRSVSGRPAGAVQVVGLDGLPDIEFGDTESELTRRGILRTDVMACGPTLAGHETVSPVFAEDRLVLLWLGEPARTPEGVTAGTPVEQVRAHYPAAVRLRAPQGTYRFDGLLARRGDRAYLFLHDGRTVRKIITGYADWAQRLFTEGHDPC
ncbi:hypothetical protein GA0070609_5606 [Micromonospora echinaurantiaca]|uniref:Uncharacterized protein n=1 Tax=Micromonospora echinaurantiaca TaxID=47857 RepID=A0A1C5K6S2_9ACTN|nr:hypothetical protein [Micromonospora echinaurantiaca]SCG78493.1 hypothetical protein GA0070609_5606 [Micromonospora echinaurantiaca]